MSPLKGLIKKDFRISRLLFVIWLSVALLFMAFGFGLSVYTKQPVGTLPIIVLSCLVLCVFSPIMMLSLLNIESKNQLWLYSPRNSSLLLLSKFVAVLSYQLILQAILTCYAVLCLYWFGKDVYELNGINFFTQAISFFNFMLLFAGVFLTCWVTFFWTVYHSLRNYPKIRPIRWLIIVAIFFGYNVFESTIIKIEAIRKLAFSYEVKIISNTSLHYDDENWKAIFETSSVPVTPFIYWFLLTLLLFFISAKLLERKVEV